MRLSFVVWSLAGLVFGEGVAVTIAAYHGPASSVVVAAVATAAWWIVVSVLLGVGAAMLITSDGHPIDRYGVPNGLTALRGFACVPLLFIATLTFSGRTSLALWAGIGGATGMLDFVDGQIARHFGPVTVLGKAIDPFGDALFFVVGAIGSHLLGIIPLWLMIFILVRYAGPVVLTPLVLLSGRRPELVYTVWGRRNTALIGAVFFVLFWVRVAGGPVDAVALIIALPTLVPTVLLHFAALGRRIAAAPRAA